MAFTLRTNADPCWCGIGDFHYGNLGIYITCAEVLPYWQVRNEVRAREVAEAQKDWATAQIATHLDPASP